MEKVILESMLSESESRERIAKKVIDDLRKQIDDLRKQMSKEVRVILTPIDVIDTKKFSKLSSKEIYDKAEKKGYPIYSDKNFCEAVNSESIYLDNYYITITKDY